MDDDTSPAGRAKPREDYVAREIPAFFAERHALRVHAPPERAYEAARIDQNFRTLTYREAHYVAGLSMGGYGALKLGLKHSARFSLAGSFSGSLLATQNTASQTVNDAFGPAGTASRAENDVVALAANARIAEGTYFYLDCGIADRLLPANRSFVQAMSARPLAYEYHEVAGAHTWEFWDRRLPVFLKLVEERIARLPAANPGDAADARNGSCSSRNKEIIFDQLFRIRRT